jgi:hypothetical protein
MLSFRLKGPAAIKASLFAAATFSLGGIAPAQAAPVECASNGLGGSDVYKIINLEALGSNGCFIGDKVFRLQLYRHLNG